MPMELIAPASEDEMIQLFIESEIASERFGSSLRNIICKLEAETGISFNSDSMDKRSCLLRRRVLSEHRGYGAGKDVFESFPENVDWVWAYLTREELKHVKYINYSYWIELTGGTRYARDAVKAIREGKRIFGVSNEGFLRAAEAVQKGTAFKPLILVAAREYPGQRIILEGHLRLTAYMLAIDSIDKVKVMIGYAPFKELSGWGLY